MAIIVIAGGIFFWYRKTKTVTVTGTNASSTNTANEITTGTYSEILTLGKNVKCDYTNTDENGTTQGTIYIKNRGEGLRSDFTLTKDGTATNSHLIVDKNTEYIWSDSEKSGIRATITDEDKKTIFSDNTQDGGLSANEKLTCRAASIEQSLLTPPSNVSFVDFSASSTKE